MPSQTGCRRCHSRQSARLPPDRTGRCFVGITAHQTQHIVCNRFVPRQHMGEHRGRRAPCDGLARQYVPRASRPVQHGGASRLYPGHESARPPSTFRCTVGTTLFLLVCLACGLLLNDVLMPFNPPPLVTGQSDAAIP
jgi:hypothetical protein